ncbi:hypothetical protein VTK73DRAFT_9407 [Phialemonium thermophilum]|uniref:DNA-(apurinic or apyrimidinic site) lyase n=1 Tax=Phialemonium thermophilum TaxID=223376 RepID=A0ABR3XK86_9PEZI
MTASAHISEWRKLPVSLTELCIETTLRCGQAFRWRKINDEWHCALQGRIVSLKQDATHLHYRVTWPQEGSRAAGDLISPLSSSTASVRGDEDDDGTLRLLHHYFSLHIPLQTLYAAWAARDANFARRAPSFVGVRILNQDPWEALVCFVCSSNNHIGRISQMIARLCARYGTPLGCVYGEPFYDFPSPADLCRGRRRGKRKLSEDGQLDEQAGENGRGRIDEDTDGDDDVETVLRSLGFGYRARYVAETARMVAQERPPNWLAGLRNPACPPLTSELTASEETAPDCSRSQTVNDRHVNVRRDIEAWAAEDGADTKKSPPQLRRHYPPVAASAGYRAAHEALLALPGVGPKVSDCVCLMGLGWAEAVPVDTHVWQIAQRDYGLRGGSSAWGPNNKSSTSGGKRTKGPPSGGKGAYDVVGDHFRGVWGPYAGWAQSVLFTANLRSFAEQAASVRQEMKHESRAVEVDIIKTEVEGKAELEAVVATRKTTVRKRAAGTALKTDLGEPGVTRVETAQARRSKRLKKPT